MRTIIIEITLTRVNKLVQILCLLHIHQITLDKKASNAELLALTQKCIAKWF